MNPVYHKVGVAREVCTGDIIGHRFRTLGHAFNKIRSETDTNAEAEMLLEQAYEARLSLPDNGKRTLMLIHELRRRNSKSPQRPEEERNVAPRPIAPPASTVFAVAPEASNPAKVM
jgi:hypothetical protein